MILLNPLYTLHIQRFENQKKRNSFVKWDTSVTKKGREVSRPYVLLLLRFHLRGDQFIDDRCYDT